MWSQLQTIHTSVYICTNLNASSLPLPSLQVREGLSRLDVDVLAYGNLEESEAAELTSTMLRGVFPPATAPASPPATSQHGWTAPSTLASAPASLESWTPTGAVKSQGEDYALSPLYDGEAPQERTVMLPKRAHVRASDRCAESDGAERVERKGWCAGCVACVTRG